jgi:ectoine hydroxylase-related dioxygenase (phytanoyl-CoA dioxygenase family)
MKVLENISCNLPCIESPFFEKILESKQLSVEYKEIAKYYNENGYAVLKNHFTEEQADRLVVDIFNKGFNGDGKEIAVDENRIQDLWKVSEISKDIATDQRILDLLKVLYDRNPIPFQTLNFKKGSTQAAHSDSIHFSSFPEKYMCGIWVALEDVDETNGPLFYYPKSHKLPEIKFQHVRKTSSYATWKNYSEYERYMEEYVKVINPNKFTFKAKKGDVLIWSSNVIHGGSKIIDENRTRLSQVTHVFFENCIYYSPLYSNQITGEYAIKNNLINMLDGKSVNQNYNGESLAFSRIRNNNYLILNYFKSFSRIISFTFLLVHQLRKLLK